MNLLKDNWIPATNQGRFQLISYQELLCKDGDWRITLSRDDMELACLQLLICMTQVVFLPKREKELIRRIKTPLSDGEYQKRIEPYEEWFDLRHAETPFMQVRGVKAKEATPIQKIFVGLPEGNNHAFFNEAGEISAVSESAAAIALFNQAMNSPNFGGGFKGGFRGGAPITTLMADESLRRRIWLNVLTEASLIEIMPNYATNKARDKPVWVDPIIEKSTIQAHEIGLLRGLFWQPAHIELVYVESEGVCDFLGFFTPMRITGFLKEKFVYDISGNWIHPHSPRHLFLKKKEEKYMSFTTTAPAWTQLNRFVVESEDGKDGFIPAKVVEQAKRLTRGKKLDLIVGGYRNKQASILQRRHELFSLKPGWEKGGASLEGLVNAAMGIKKVLRNKLWGFSKNTGATNVYEFAERIFYHRSERLIHQALREMDWRENAATIEKLQKDLISLSRTIFNEVTHSYRNDPKMIKALVVSRRSMNAGFKKLTGEVP